MANPNIATDSPKTWKPGQSGNPAGRPPKGYSITEIMKEIVASKVMGEDGKTEIEVRKALGSVILEKALKGDMNAIKLIWEYMDGKATQKIEADLNNRNVEDGINKLAEIIHDCEPDRKAEDASE